MGVGAAPRPAVAALLAGTEGPAPELVARTLVVGGDGATSFVQETLAFRGVSGRFAHFFASPAAPRFEAPVAGLAEQARAATVRRPPLRYGIRDAPLGPSLARRLWPPAAPSADSGAEATDAGPEVPLEVVTRQGFRGAASTSSTTRRVLFPPELQRFFTRHQLEVEPAVAGALARHLNQGDTVTATIYEPARAARTPGTRFIAGPVRWTLASPDPVRALSRPEGEPMVEAFTLGPAPRTPEATPVTWSETPWTLTVPELGQTVVFGWGPGPDGDDRGDDGGAGGLGGGAETAAVSGPAVVAHVRYRPAREPYRALRWTAAEAPPAAPRPGTFTDVFWVILFGAVPVFAAPESWLLYILQRRARDRATPTRVSPVTRIWSLWPVVVALWWLVQAQGAARWAALLPGAIALLGLRRHQPEPQRFVRARFEKKKKKSGKS